jgi:ABC-2 type transport system ATP-binding protein
MLNMLGDAIRIEAIAKSFANAPVLRDVTLRVRVGEIMALVGPNGSGKTTLLEILATLQLPTAGRATIGGFDVVRQAGQIRRIVGYCAAGAESFYPQLTGRVNLEFFAALHGLSPQEARTRTCTVLETMGASEVGDVAVQRYSAGMKQRLSLARALLADAPILLLDEPTRSLDADARCEFHRLLRQTLAGATNKAVLLVTHDPNEASAVCDRVAVLSGGAIARVRTVDDAATVLVAAHSAAG